MKYEVLKRPPLSGEFYEIHFGKTSSDSIWIKFSPTDSEDWVGSFANGKLGFINRKILDFDPHSKFAVLNNGAFYMIDPITRELLKSDDESYYCDFEIIPEMDLLFLASFWAIFIYKGNDKIKVIKPDFIDGISFTNKNNSQIIGEISDPGNEKSEFVLDINTLKLKWGDFEF
jgi:hypothetical protein